MKILGVATSPRVAGIKPEILSDIVESKDIENKIYEVGYTGKVSNSETLLLASLWGAKQEGADVELFYPNKQDVLPDYDGIVMSTPVYFGDRSSGLHKFIRMLEFNNTAVGIVSSGAKRNGGQETTNIYALYDCLCKGALITGNGPPTAQYGGTGWAGNKTAIVNDDFGIKTSIGTGRQVAKLSKVVLSKESTETPKILLLKVTKDDILIPDTFFGSETTLLDISNKQIKRCVACPICPNGDLTDSYTCIIRNDDMREIQEAMQNSDCVIFVSGTDDTQFQVFIERTRFIRRNHFELAERVYSSMSFTDMVTDILPLRVMTNMLRQNMFGLPFFKSFKGYRNMSMHLYKDMIVSYTKKSMTMRNESGIDFEYTAVGYEDAKINERAYRD